MDPIVVIGTFKPIVELTEIFVRISSVVNMAKKNLNYILLIITEINRTNNY